MQSDYSYLSAAVTLQGKYLEFESKHFKPTRVFIVTETESLFLLSIIYEGDIL